MASSDTQADYPELMDRLKKHFDLVTDESVPRGYVDAEQPNGEMLRLKVAEMEAALRAQVQTAEAPREMTVKEAGRKGGEAVKAKYGVEHYSKIGQIGGEAVARQRGAAFYAEIGKKGGQAVRDGQDADFYARIGRRGGEAVKAKFGPDYYSAIGKVGGAVKAK